MKNELKPCPFCGGNPDVQKEYPIGNHYPFNEDDLRSPIFYVGCAHCGISIGYSIDFWNTRPAEDAKDAEIERLKAVIVKLTVKLENLKIELKTHRNVTMRLTGVSSGTDYEICQRIYFLCSNLLEIINAPDTNVGMKG